MYLPEATSRTFHGRDVFAPAAGHLSLGLSPEAQGPWLEDPVSIDGCRAISSEDDVDGRVVHVDRYGNAITNVPAELLSGKRVIITLAELKLNRMVSTYAAVAPGDSVALIGSQDTLEISVNGGEAAKQFGTKQGDVVRVRWVS